MNIIDLDQQLISTNEAAKRLGVCRRTILNRVTDGSLTAYRVGSLYRFDPADVDSLAVPVKP